MIDIAINNQILLGIAIVVVLILIGNVLYIFLKDHQKDKEEIKELMNIVPKRMEQKTEEVQEKKTEIEEMLDKMQHDLEAKSEDVVENFEKEQEETSIISYQELLKTLNKEVSNPKEAIPVKMEPDSVETPMTQQIMDEEIQQPKLEAMKETKPNTEQAIKKFKNTEFISPIYGKMEGKLEYPTVPSFQAKEEKMTSQSVEDVIQEFDRKLEHHNMDDYLENYGFHNHMKIDSLEQTLNMPPISPEIKANEEFLQALKEFRKNLE